jgi:hypothetical protein
MSMLLGFVFLVCMPMGALILFITLVGIPIGLFALALCSALLPVADVSAGIGLGDWALRPWLPEHAGSTGLAVSCVASDTFAPQRSCTWPT